MVNEFVSSNSWKMYYSRVRGAGHESGSSLGRTLQAKQQRFCISDEVLGDVR